MKFRKVVAGAVLVQGIALLGPSAAHANVILSYTGNDFTFVTTPYTDTDRVTATITLAQPLGDNLNLSSVTPLAFSLDDGVQTITNAQPIAASVFQYTTNATGAITAWHVDVLVQTSQVVFPEIDSLNEPSVNVFDLGKISTGAFGSNSASPGSWTETNVAVPAPPLSNLAALGVLGLAFFWRRRRQILDRVRYSTQP
jgi:MYXO-CTERM domain-containing protein